MATPTLLVRLLGLYLLSQCSLGLYTLHRVQTFAGVSLPANPFVGDLTPLLIGGLILGLAATAFAGPLARLLTFDAHPRAPRSAAAELLR